MDRPLDRVGPKTWARHREAWAHLGEGGSRSVQECSDCARWYLSLLGLPTIYAHCGCRPKSHARTDRHRLSSPERHDYQYHGPHRE